MRLTDSLFQLPDPPAQGRLGYMHDFSGMMKMQLLGNRHEISEMSKFQVSSFRFQAAT
jgi:hypothetical protein